MSFLDLQNGIAIESTPRDTAKVYRTTDGGLSWNYLSKVISNTYYISLLDIYYLDEKILITAGFAAFKAVVYQSNSGGLTWIFRLYAGNSSSVIAYNKMQFINSTTGFLLTNGGMTSMYRAYIYKTLNSGTSWSQVDDGTLPLCNSIFMLDENNGYAVGYEFFYFGSNPGAIYKTSNGGNSWVQQINITATKLNDIYFVDSNNGIAVGNAGVIFKTTNGGVTFIEEENNFTQPREFLLSQNYPNPFNPSTKISWQVPVSGWQTLKVYDVLGNEVATLVNEYRPAGTYEIEFSTTGGPESRIQHPASGIYFYRLQAGSFVDTKKMILLK